MSTLTYIKGQHVITTACDLRIYKDAEIHDNTWLQQHVIYGYDKDAELHDNTWLQQHVIFI